MSSPLSSMEQRALRYLERYPDRPPRLLKRTLGLSWKDTMAVLKQLEARGLIERRPNRRYTPLEVRSDA